MSSPRIVIIGAGPAGLTLSLLLHKQHIPFTIYELRAKPTEEALARPSGMLDLREESGLEAIRACGLYEDFLPLTGECSQAMRVTNADGAVLHADEGNNKHRPEISRHALTRLLLSKLPAETIRWEHKLIRATPAANNTTELDFGPVHGTVTADLVIGADGAWSRVRPLLTPVKPFYSGVHFITLTIEHVTARYPHLADLVGPGSFASLADHKGIITQRGGRDSIRSYLAVSTPDEHLAITTGIAGLSPQEAKTQILGDASLFGVWEGPTRELIERACEEDHAEKLDEMALYMLPVDKLAWEHKSGITLVGDAAHLMTPFAGEGVNLALWDVLDLSRVVGKAYGGDFHQTLEPLMKEFEKAMVKRTEGKAELTWKNLQVMFGDDAATTLAANIKARSG
ncbi:putative salicylate hydroxylase [Mycena galericulata]|nr:putative salicylate hydroxylase [Mycena galericulata]